MSRTKEIAFQLSRQASGINPSAPEYTGPPEHWTEAVTRLEAENATQAEEIARLREALRVFQHDYDKGELAINYRVYAAKTPAEQDKYMSIEVPGLLDKIQAALKSSAK